MSERKISSPPLNPENQPFWDAARQGRLALKRCNDCGQPHYYPRVLCPFCFSDKTEWFNAKGGGEIYTYSVLRRGVPVPYALAYVTLDEGPTMLTNIVDGDLDALAVGQRVKLVFKPAEDGTPVPMFTPV